MPHGSDKPLSEDPWILIPHRWKSVQLSILTLWNVSSRDACLERRVIESDAAVKLLDVVCNEAWPPSLRDMAGGFLSFLSERRSNLAHFPVVDLPTDVKWPLAKPPTDGLVPAIAGYINLINSRCGGRGGAPSYQLLLSGALAQVCRDGGTFVPGSAGYLSQINSMWCGWCTLASAIAGKSMCGRSLAHVSSFPAYF